MDDTGLSVGQALFGTDLIEKYRGQNTITVATGATCAYLGDERNLREYLVADELVKELREQGHVVHFLLFDDDLDPLNYRQLRVAVNKDARLVEEFEPYCGKPISTIRSPHDHEAIWSTYFEKQLVKRLAELDCHPTVISVSKMYERGMYAPYIKQALLHEDRILSYLAENFAGYQPEKLFYAICPTCGYIDGTNCSEANDESVAITCQRCLRSTRLTYEVLRGKLSWKLDCAARWAMFRVSIEPFTKSYLEPKTGSYHVAQGLAKTFFGVGEVTPLLVGMVYMPKELSNRLLPSLPTSVFRSLFVKHFKTDLELTEKRVMTEASKVEVLDDYTYTDVVKQLLPSWLLDSSGLDSVQRELVSKGLKYAREFMGSEIKSFIANRTHLEDCPVDVLRALNTLIQQVIVFRRVTGNDYQAFMVPAKSVIEHLGDQRKAVTKCLRQLVGQEEGLPNSKFLFLLPISYLENLSSLLELYLDSQVRTYATAVVEEQASSPSLRIVSGERLAFDR